jgi:23S rRNA pseudouridine1911/1915/1917 synthase
MTPLEPRQVTIAEAGQRLDVFLVQHMSEFTRAHVQKAIEAEAVRVNGRPSKSGYRLRAGDVVLYQDTSLPREGPPGEDIPLEVLFEDDALVVVNKPPGMVVHPGKGNWQGTLAAALAHRFERLSTLGGEARPGIVHRLDRDTSGVIVVAKTDAAHAALAEQFAARTVEKEYFAIVVGVPDRDRDVVDLPIGPHPHERQKKAVRRDHPEARPARTLYEVGERFAGFAAVRAFPKTGRTHQVRIHLAAVGCPVLCDRLYGGRARITLEEIAKKAGGWRLEAGDKTTEEAPLLERQALHARRIRFAHPQSGETLEFVAPLPADIASVLDALREHRRI